MNEVIAFLGGGGATIIAIVFYAFMWPEKAEKVVGWAAALVAHIVRRVDRTAVAYSVQGDINSARTELLRNAPGELIDKKLKIKWADVAEAEALIKEGEVLVVMQRSQHHEENVAHALMAYLPKAMLPRARRYLDKQRMRAADLLVARAVLSQDETPAGTISVFFDAHLDPARSESKDLKKKIDELDEIDLQGWLTRVLLTEYRVLGDELYPGEPDKTCRRDAEEFARWLHQLAVRKRGEWPTLIYRGRYFRVGVIWVAEWGKLEEYGLEPYRKRAKRYLYGGQFDAVYLMARDDNIPAVEQLVANLETDARVASAICYRYPLRSDFKKRKLHRSRAIVACLRRRKIAGEPMPPEVEDDADLGEERYEPALGTG